MADFVDVNGVRITPQLPADAVPVGDRGRAMLSAAACARLRAEVADAVRPDAEAIAGPAAGAAVAGLVDAFWALYPDRPVADNAGGAGFNHGLWLYLIARLLDPALIVESGVWKGQTSWLLRAACPRAEIDAFDVSLARLATRSASVRYHEGDWTKHPIGPVDPERSLAVFDDHISHARRLLQAAERGFRHVLLDDNYPAHRLHATGSPPVPTLAMLLDPTLDPEAEIRWTRKGKHYRYRPDAELMAAARAVLDRVVPLADLHPVTGHAPLAGLTYVALAAGST